MIKKERWFKVRLDEFELKRLGQLAGLIGRKNEDKGKLTNYVTTRMFEGTADKANVTTVHQKPVGWSVVERDRRDGGIMIAHAQPPLGFTSPMVLYPEDVGYDEYTQL